MSIRRNSNKNSHNPLARIVVSIVVVLVILSFFKSLKKQTTTSVIRHTAPAVREEPVRNPIMKLLTESSSAIAERDGIVIGVAFDVSGSMGDKVAGTDGQQLPKIQIARQCAMDVLKQADIYSRSHPETPLEVGIYEFSTRSGKPSCRRIIPFGPVKLDRAFSSIEQMRAEGGTPIGDAVIRVKQEMDRTGLKSKHLLVITDGENNQGYHPSDVVDAISRLEENKRASVYFFAFDVAAEKFNAVRDAGGLIMAAANGRELQQTLDYVLTGKILVEQTEQPGAK